jgi:hypothetical protein
VHDYPAQILIPFPFSTFFQKKNGRVNNLPVSYVLWTKKTCHIKTWHGKLARLWSLIGAEKINHFWARLRPRRPNLEKRPGDARYVTQLERIRRTIAGNFHGIWLANSPAHSDITSMHCSHNSEPFRSIFARSIDFTNDFKESYKRWRSLARNLLLFRGWPYRNCVRYRHIVCRSTYSCGGRVSRGLWASDRSIAKSCIILWLALRGWCKIRTANLFCIGGDYSGELLRE